MVLLHQHNHNKMLESINIEEATERDLRKLALEIKTKLKEWFTESQIAKLYSNDKKNEIIGSLNFLGLIESDNIDGGWKYRIIDSAEKRIEILNKNIAVLSDTIDSSISNKKYLETLLEEVKLEI